MEKREKTGAIVLAAFILTVFSVPAVFADGVSRSIDVGHSTMNQGAQSFQGVQSGCASTRVAGGGTKYTVRPGERGGETGSPIKINPQEITPTNDRGGAADVRIGIPRLAHPKGEIGTAVSTNPTTKPGSIYTPNPVNPAMYAYASADMDIYKAFWQTGLLPKEGLQTPVVSPEQYLMGLMNGPVPAVIGWQPDPGRLALYNKIKAAFQAVGAMPIGSSFNVKLPIHK